MTKLLYPAPSQHQISSGFYDWRVINGWPAMHAADDFPVPIGTQLVATHNGRVIWAGWIDNNTGFVVVILDESGKFQTRSLHMSRIDVMLGQNVLAGQQIGLSGNTGLSTGPHVHFAVWFYAKADAVLIQKTPVLAYGMWAVNPILMILYVEDDMASYFDEVITDWQGHKTTRGAAWERVLGELDSGAHGSLFPRIDKGRRTRDFIVRKDTNGAVFVLVVTEAGTWKRGVVDGPTFHALGGEFTPECLRQVANAEFDAIPVGPNIKFTP